MTDIRPCVAKTHEELALEWDQLAEERHRQITAGEDLSFEHVVVPMMLRLFDGAKAKLVLDIGSGTGDFTLRLAQVAKQIIGVEPSRNSVAVARKNCRRTPNVRFIQTPLETAVDMLRGESVTAAVACMTLMTTPRVSDFAEALAALLQNEAKFIAILSHPWFWPRYWEYEKEAWFNYTQETFIEAPFVISRCRTTVRTTHVHRPLEQYVNVFTKAGFRLETLEEPIPSQEIQSLYPGPWQFPRFIGLKWVKAV